MTLTLGNSTLDDLEHDELPEEIDASKLIPVESVTQDLRGLFQGFPKYDGEYIVGEVSELSNQQRGHLYFSLEAAYTEGTLNCAVWERKRPDIELELNKNMLVAVKGELQFYEDGGHPTLHVDDIHLVGESAYWRRIEELKSQLEAEGLFDDERKDELPTLPGTVGVATAAQSDAEQDIIDSIHGHYPDVDIVVKDTPVQGDAALETIATTVQALDRTETDVLIVSRGGGSDSDLRVFNEEPVIRAVAEAETPTVSAIGHEADEPLVDQVADARAKTPTAAGATVVPEKAEFTEQIADARKNIRVGYKRQVLRWQADHHEWIQIEYDRLATQWAELAVTEISQSYSELVSNWMSTTRPSIERAASSHTASWLQTNAQAINAEYSQLTERWVTRQRSEIEQAVEKIEQQEQFEEQTEGLRRQRVILTVLLVLFGLAALALLINQFIL
jgi:exodeoxyribonuclease VII large subunit